MTKTRLSYVMAVTLALVACGDDSGGGGSIPLEDIPDRLEDAVCARAVDCGAVPDQATCEATIFFFGPDEIEELQAAIDRGTVVYDGNAAAQCLEDFAESFGSCTLSEAAANPDTGPPDSCANAIRGQVALGGGCLIDDECMGGTSGDAECDPGDGCTTSCCMGTCTAISDPPPIGQGMACTFEDVCADGLYCDSNGSAGTCQPQVSSGPCTSFEACAPPMVCNLDFGTGMGTCYRPAGEGATCDPMVPFGACDRFDNWCDPGDTTCKKKPRPGETCTVEVDNCASWAWCMGGTCAALPGEGQPCAGANGDECMGGLVCEGGDCTAPPSTMACVSAG